MVLDDDSGFSSGEISKESLERRMMETRLSAVFETKVRNCNELCWDLCVGKTGAKLDQKTATCLSNCVDRFMDSTNFITQRLFQPLKANQYGS